MTTYKFRYLFFDLGGVVLSLRDGFGKLSREIDRPEALVKAAYAKHVDAAARGRVSTQEFWRQVKAELNLPENGPIPDYGEYFTNNIVPIPETHALLRELSSRYQIGIITNTELGIVEQEFRKGHIPDLPYCLVLKSCDVGVVKPEAQIFLLTQARVSARPEEILFVDDREENIQAAEALGWTGILFDEQDLPHSIEAVRAKLR